MEWLARSQDLPGLVNVHITMENHHFLMGKLTISMAIFNSYVSLPEGTGVFYVGLLNGLGKRFAGMICDR